GALGVGSTEMRETPRRLHYHRRFFSLRLANARDLIVWLPPNYDKEIERRYPVIYVHDGQNLFDPATAFAGVDWQLGKTADSLISAGKVDPMIIVGIANTPARLEEYSPAKGRDYAAFLIDEVKPFIDRTYRTLPQYQHTAVMGSSLGGLISFYLAWWHPQVFSMAGCLSATWMWENSAAIRMVDQESSTPPDIKIYLDHGSEGGEGRQAWIYRSMRDALLKRGFKLGKNLAYYFGVGDEHNETAWGRRIERPLIFFFGKHRC
ncbi:MAG: alpha/beta hydrolase-fold protein, partial [candidate division KSB1 bacterium]|nr:alpha/beta hydrolase-fold protein [candidate division KSB1 bacterium]